jgi:GTP-binding protein Era
MEDRLNTKCGRVVIFGRPNTGKSTLLNAIMQQKVTVTSPMPQTTRKSIRVIYNDERGKIIFIDTPGIIGKVEDLVGKSINDEAPKEINKAEIVVMLVDISREKSDEDNKAIGWVRKSKSKKILVYNKVDKVDKGKDYLPEYNYLEEEFDRVISVSALKEKNIKGLVNLIFELLPEEVDESIKEEIASMEAENKPLIGSSAEDFVAELIREKAYLYLRREVPYSVNVEVASIEDKGKIIVVKAFVFTTADRYKKMIIGSNGSKIKQIGYNARKELELMSGRKIYLELEVRVDKHWPERYLI